MGIHGDRYHRERCMVRRQGLGTCQPNFQKTPRSYVGFLITNGEAILCPIFLSGVKKCHVATGKIFDKIDFTQVSQSGIRAIR